MKKCTVKRESSLTTSYVVAEIPEEKKAPMPGGGHPGMGGMGGMPGMM
jgi:hypothetical protein